jgi:phenylacetate-coenzyme A ligase PaaK-like adenylate-forming protein
MFWFGDKLENESNWREDAAWKALSSKRRALSQIKVDTILKTLDAFSEVWNPDSEVFKKALAGLIKESGFSEEETRKTLGMLSSLLKRESLEKRLKGEFTRSEVLDKFVKLPHQTALVHAVPAGIVLHVTAGNVFLSSIDSLIMGFLTKNLSVLKVSSQNKFFPMYFAEELQKFDRANVLADKFAVLHWKGGEEKIESFIKSKVNTIIAWGGEEMISSYQKNLPTHVKLLDFGPKISLQVITKDGLDNKKMSAVAAKIVADVVPWDQAACASPQNLYLQMGIDHDALLREIDLSFTNSAPRGPISDDEATEILKEKYRGYYSELMENGKVLAGDEHLLHLEDSKILKPSPLNRSLIIKRFTDLEELFTLLEPFAYYLQSCSYLLSDEEKNQYLPLLAQTGLKRFAPLGTITWGMEGAPHDGRFVLRELVNFIANEQRAQDYGEEVLTVHNSVTLKKHFEETPHPEGYIFSSGGTTGEPKFVHFSYEEFDFMSDMLATNLKKQGIRSGMIVANLFVAGNLWSSFMCVENALEKIGAIQLPIGGMCSNENILLYLKKFRPDVVMGIPSMLVMNAEFSASQNEELHVPYVFYAGEALSPGRKDYLEKTWGTKVFGSAGYASVDAGVIGYQCTHCGPGEHHIFSDLIELSIIEDEAVVTSLARSTMPVKNYRTGDKIEWISDCDCGSSDRRFKLLGRVDNIIQIWSCRLLTTDVEHTMNAFGVLTFQLTITEGREANLVREKLAVTFEASQEFDQEEFLLDLYNRSRDVKDTISFMDFKKDIILKPMGVGEIPRNPRTGKISLVQDLRR